MCGKFLCPENIFFLPPPRSKQFRGKLYNKEKLLWLKGLVDGNYRGEIYIHLSPSTLFIRVRCQQNLNKLLWYT
jgi:hypothetical protein